MDEKIPVKVKSLVFERDERSCRLCGAIWSKDFYRVVYLRLRYDWAVDEANLITVCEQCEAVVLKYKLVLMKCMTR